MVVVVEVFGEAGTQFCDRTVVTEENVLPFHGAPEPLDHDIVEGASASIHADADAASFQEPQPICAGELAALIGVVDFRPPLRKRPLQRAHAKGAFHGIGHFPGQHITAGPIHDRDQVSEPIRQAHVGDVRAPDLVKVDGVKFNKNDAAAQKKPELEGKFKSSGSEFPQGVSDYTGSAPDGPIYTETNPYGIVTCCTDKQPPSKDGNNAASNITARRLVWKWDNQRQEQAGKES